MTLRKVNSLHEPNGHQPGSKMTSNQITSTCQPLRTLSAAAGPTRLAPNAAKAADERQGKPLLGPNNSTAARPAEDYQQLLQRLVLDNYCPAAVLINDRYEILSVLGPMANYLEFPAGEITNNLFGLARFGL
ncbi:MAG: hypothetical protein KDA37_17870, partial [Planctomycetales bacterium]|nr:hypothetical protein [Planctomycetales bacterium]